MTTNRVDVHCTQTSRGWLVDAYIAGTAIPCAGTQSTEHMPRFATLADAHAHARHQYRHRINRITPEINP